MKGDIILRKGTTRNFIDTRNRFLVFKNNAPFTNCISKINIVSVDNAEDLDIVMTMYNLSTVKITEKRQEVFEIITEMNLIILILMMMTPLLLITMQTL